MPFALEKFLGLGDVIHTAGKVGQGLIGPVGVGGVGGVTGDDFGVGAPFGLRGGVLQFQITHCVLIDECLRLCNQGGIAAATGAHQ